MADLTLTDRSLYGSSDWVVMTIGKSKDWFAHNKKRMEADGFPKKDPIISLWIKADVEAWINKRRKFSDNATLIHMESTEVNHDAL